MKETIRRRYYIHYWNNFGNTYDLVYAETPEQLAAVPAGAEQITRKAALAKAREEAARRKDDAAFSGYAPASIYPAGHPGDIENDRRYELINRIWERRNAK